MNTPLRIGSKVYLADVEDSDDAEIIFISEKFSHATVWLKSAGAGVDGILPKISLNRIFDQCCPPGTYS